MSPRVPFVVLLAGAMAGAVVAGSADDDSAPATVEAEPGLQMPAEPAADVLASTWYCAAGTAEEGGMADQTIVVLNTGDDEINGTISVFAGEVMAGESGASGAATSDDEASEASEATATGAGAGGDRETAQQPDGGAQEPGVGEDEGGDGEEPTLGDAWSHADQGQEQGQPEEPGAGPGAQPDARQDVQVPPGGRVELRVADLHQAPLASALVELDGPGVVEHEVTGPQGRDLGPCASTASPDWYLAWGATTRDARELLVLFNPFPSVAAVDIVLSTDDGLREPVRYQGLPVPAGGVVGVDVGGEVTRRDQVAATVRSRSGPIVVERVQQFDGAGATQGLSVALAAPSPLDTWIFPAGTVSASRGERIVLYNPGDRRAEVDVAVRPAGQGADAATPPQPFGVTVPPGRYEVVDYAEDERVPRDGLHTTIVRSRNGVPVVAERVLTFNRRRDGDLAAGSGSAFASPSWAFATLGSGDRPAARLVAFNPDPDRPARVSVTALVDGQPVPAAGLQDVQVPPGALSELELGDDVRGPERALMVEADAPVVVERLVSTPGGLLQAVGPGLPATDGAVPVSGFDPN